jgi:uncharacterized protein with HEPN domain
MLILAGEVPISRIALFGSYAREEQRADSDIDILVEVDPSIGLRFSALAEELERLLEEPVELVSSRAISRIAEYTIGLTREGFLADRLRIDAVVRNLEIIGEAARRMTEDTRNRAPDIEWRQIIGLRNRVVREYFCVDTEIAWQIVSHDLTPLRLRLTSTLPLLPSD